MLMLMLTLTLMASAATTTFIGFSLIFRRKSPQFKSHFFLPKLQLIDRNLIGGAILFGIGWGLYSYCPEPAIAWLVYLSPVTLLFVACLWIGMRLANSTPWIQVKLK
jgi:uncharacterized membrane protein YedE/YeeE